MSKRLGDRAIMSIILLSIYPKRSGLNTSRSLYHISHAYVNAIMPSDQAGLAGDFMLFFSGFIKYKLPSTRYIYITVHCITSTSTLYSK